MSICKDDWQQNVYFFSFRLLAIYLWHFAKNVKNQASSKWYSLHTLSSELKIVTEQIFCGALALLFCFSFYRLHISLIYPVDFFAFFRYQKKSNVIFLTRGGVWGFGYFTCENCVKNCVIWQKCSISLLEWCGKNEA